MTDPNHIIPMQTQGSAAPDQVWVAFCPRCWKSGLRRFDCLRHGIPVPSAWVSYRRANLAVPAPNPAPVSPETDPTNQKPTRNEREDQPK